MYMSSLNILYVSLMMRQDVVNGERKYERLLLLLIMTYLYCFTCSQAQVLTYSVRYVYYI